MATNVINAELLAKMFLAGAKNLESKKAMIPRSQTFLYKSNHFRASRFVYITKKQ